jgi:hypothetical protein
MKPWLDKMGTFGAVVAAAACPICFPKLAIVGAALGLSFLTPYERYAYIAIQVLVIAALLGHVWAFRRHRNVYLMVLAAIGTLASHARIIRRKASRRMFIRHHAASRGDTSRSILAAASRSAVRRSYAA